MYFLNLNEIYEKFSFHYSSLIKFIQSIIKEARSLKLPGSKETISYLIIVLLMAFLCSILFFSIDSISYKIINYIIAKLI